MRATDVGGAVCVIVDKTGSVGCAGDVEAVNVAVVRASWSWIGLACS